MPRKPKDDVAASTTITLRLTPDDRQRIERQIKARAAELPEPSISALLRRLVRDGEDAVLLRLAVEDRALLGRLVHERIAELAKMGVHEAVVTESSVLVALIREAGKARALTTSSGSQASETDPAAVLPKGAHAPALTSATRADRQVPPVRRRR